MSLPVEGALVYNGVDDAVVEKKKLTLPLSTK